VAALGLEWYGPIGLTPKCIVSITTMNVRLRRQSIVQAVRSEPVPVSTLATTLGCSEMTVRRDLDALELQGVIRRVHGGAVAFSLRSDEVPYAIRTFEAAESKARIAAAVAALIADGETVVLDCGTTTAEIGRALGGRAVTIMPLGLRTLIDLAYDDQVRLIAPGGDVRSGELVMTGDLAELAFERLRFDTFVLGCCGINAHDGVTTHVPADARIKRAAIASSLRTILVSDASKFGEVAFARVCGLDALERLVTDATSTQTSELESAGLTIDRV
jgi:DeoR/GlpR family transcriptional regulator of sugar metabolism